ncbi:hypothetical protein BH20BAC1_BH20BAC1_21610 [soil metagenome]
MGVLHEIAFLIRTQLPRFAYKAEPLKLHPTEHLVTYQSYQNGKHSLYAVALDGSKQLKLTENPQRIRMARVHS